MRQGPASVPRPQQAFLDLPHSAMVSDLAAIAIARAHARRNLQLFPVTTSPAPLRSRTIGGK
jgi:hypothetical protein